MPHLHKILDIPPNLVCYERLVALILSVLGPLIAYLRSLYGACTGISFIASTSLAVCDNQVFEGFAQRDKTSMGWFYSIKLHFTINDCGEPLACQLTPGNVDDRVPVPLLAKRLFGKLFAAKDYISQIEHTRHRSLINFFVNVIAGLIAYCPQPKKPSLNLHTKPMLSAYP